MRGKIMWNTDGFLDTSVDKSQLVNMAINRVFFSTTLIKDSPSTLTQNPNHITGSVLDPKVLHQVSSTFTIKGTRVVISFTYGYNPDVLIIAARAGQVEQEFIFKQTPEGLDIQVNSGPGFKDHRKVLERKFVCDDSELEGEENGGTWVEAPYEGGNLSIDGLLEFILGEFPELAALGDAEAGDWL
jgi:hypothetical protein